MESNRARTLLVAGPCLLAGFAVGFGLRAALFEPAAAGEAPTRRSDEAQTPAGTGPADRTVGIGTLPSSSAGGRAEVGGVSEVGEAPVDELLSLEELEARLEARLEPLRGTLQWLASVSPEAFGDMSLSELHFLRELDFTDASFEDADLAHLRHLPSLSEVQLRRSSVTDEGLSYLKDVPRLAYVGLRDTAVTDAGMVHVEAIDGLTRLDLNLTSVGDEGLAHLRNKTDLTFLRLNYTQITDAGLAYLSGMDSLERLDLWAMPITDEALTALWHLPSLVHLELGANDLSREAVERFMADHPDCYVRSPWSR